MQLNRIPELFGASRLALVAAALAVFALAGSANAQYQAVGADGIAASPKVRQALNQRQASAAVATTTRTAMACPKCKDVTVAQPNRQAKGAEILMGAATKVVTTHACADCDTKLAMVGAGKATRTVATHTCTAPGVDRLVCCAPAPGK
jgi:hypothetical protein